MSERICVCGLGKVGKPILDTLRMKGFKTVGYDIRSELTEFSLEKAVEATDAAIFIVPTPSLDDGSFTDTFLWDALNGFKSYAESKGKPDYLFIVTSTTVPGMCDKFKRVLGIKNICYKPEFIRLEYVRSDLLSPAIILIGESNKEAGDRCEFIFRQIADDAPVLRMSMLEAELAKITLNCALTMKISLANQLHLVAQKLGANSIKIMDAVGADPRIGQSYLIPGWPYGGPCLPRDNRMFRFVAQSVGIDACLSEAADKINKMVGG